MNYCIYFRMKPQPIINPHLTTSFVSSFFVGTKFKSSFTTFPQHRSAHFFSDHLSLASLSLSTRHPPCAAPLMHSFLILSILVKMDRISHLISAASSSAWVSLTAIIQNNTTEAVVHFCWCFPFIIAPTPKSHKKMQSADRNI